MTKDDLISRQPETHDKRTETHACDLIKRQDAIDAAVEAADEWDGGYSRSREEIITLKLRMLPSAEPEQDREFIKLTVRNSNGRPYYSIIYLEFDDNGVGHDFEGYSSYSLDVISDYMKKYFMPSAQPEQKKGEWIPYLPEGLRYKCSECESKYDTPWHFCPNCGSYNGGENHDKG